MRVRVRVTSDSRKERFEELAEHVFSAAVKEPAARNQANTRVRQLIAARYRVPLSAVRFIKGTRSPNKLFEVVR